MLDDTERELKEIRKWINKDRNKFDSKTRYLISYSVIKASGTIEVVFKHLIFDYLVVGAKEETKTYLENMIVESSCNPKTGNMSNMLQSISAERKHGYDEKSLADKPKICFYEPALFTPSGGKPYVRRKSVHL